MLINFGEWLPDQPRLGNSCITATNVYPAARGYKPFPGPSPQTDALSAKCIGWISFKRTSGAIEVFAGTATKLYRLNNNSWTDVSKAGNYTSSDFWRFALYGDRLVATNGTDNPQAFDLASDSVFADLPNAPIHDYPIVVRDVIVALNCASGNEIQFSAVNDSEDWTVASGGGSQPVLDGGPVIGGTGGEYGVILQEYGLTRMSFVGGDLRFTFDKLEGSVGCIARNSIVQYKGSTFYLSDEGFQLFDGASSQNISDEVVTKTFFSELVKADPLITEASEIITTETGDPISVGTLEQIEGALDQGNSCVIWKYPTAAGNKLIIYNYRLQRWASSDQAINSIGALVELGGPIFAGFDSDHKLSPFNGSDLSAVVSTGDIQLSRDRASFVRAVRGLVDSAHDVTVGKKTSLSDTEATATGSSNSRGKVSLRSHGRYHRFQVEPTATFSELTGISIEASPGGTKV